MRRIRHAVNEVHAVRVKQRPHVIRPGSPADAIDVHYVRHVYRRELAQPPALGCLGGALADQVQPRDLAAPELDPVLFCPVDHAIARSYIYGQGLFTEDMFAGLRRCDHDFLTQ